MRDALLGVSQTDIGKMVVRARLISSDLSAEQDSEFADRLR